MSEAIWPDIRFERAEVNIVHGFALLVDGDSRTPIALGARFDDDVPQDFERACGRVREGMHALVTAARSPPALESHRIA